MNSAPALFFTTLLPSHVFTGFYPEDSERKNKKKFAQC